MSRPSWEEYFMSIAGQVATRSTCLRRQVGCIIVVEKRIVATGYNGAPVGLPHCEEVGCLRERQGVSPGERHELCRGLHAEQNAIIQAAMHGTAVRGGVLYCTHKPCVLCTKMLINAGITRIYYREGYRDTLADDLAGEAGLQLVCMLEEAPGCSTF
ncbi:cytidine/deoxycytidylate deaminase family protein [Candidatus Solincola tengchongensis]|uniref:deoxycytidylate deaminase n=1 Tax=Candidatus Solincola tengchongensis TaxID=2900693 RepID=UPI00257DA67A